MKTKVCPILFAGIIPVLCNISPEHIPDFIVANKDKVHCLKDKCGWFGQGCPAHKGGKIEKLVN